jgi:hypothetical protein
MKQAQLHDTAELEAEAARLAGWAFARARIAAGIGIVGFIVAIIFGVMDGADVFFRAYILNYCYVLSFVLGALFFVMLQHLTRAGWSVSLRRLAEIVMSTMPIWRPLFVPMLIPVVAGMGGVYLWTDPEVVSPMTRCSSTKRRFSTCRSSSFAA